jgi:hypothetical protein
VPGGHVHPAEAQLRQFDADAAPMDQQLADAQAKLDVVRDMAGRDLPSEPRVDYDLWMVWVASLTDTSGFDPAHSLNNSKIEQHTSWTSSSTTRWTSAVGCR